MTTTKAPKRSLSRAGSLFHSWMVNLSRTSRRKYIVLKGSKKYGHSGPFICVAPPRPLVGRGGSFGTFSVNRVSTPRVDGFWVLLLYHLRKVGSLEGSFDCTKDECCRRQWTHKICLLEETGRRVGPGDRSGMSSPQPDGSQWVDPLPCSIGREVLESIRSVEDPTSVVRFVE